MCRDVRVGIEGKKVERSYHDYHTCISADLRSGAAAVHKEWSGDSENRVFKVGGSRRECAASTPCQIPVSGVEGGAEVTARPTRIHES